MASRTEIDKQLEHRALRYVSHATGSANAIALDKSGDDLDSFGLRQLFMMPLRCMEVLCLNAQVLSSIK